MSGTQRSSHAKAQRPVSARGGPIQGQTGEVRIMRQESSVEPRRTVPGGRPGRRRFRSAFHGSPAAHVTRSQAVTRVTARKQTRVASWLTTEPAIYHAGASGPRQTPIAALAALPRRQWPLGRSLATEQDAWLLTPYEADGNPRRGYVPGLCLIGMRLILSDVPNSDG
jgi:hypothetical protein